MGIFSSKKNIILTNESSDSLSKEQIMNALIKKIETKILDLKTNGYLQLGTIYEQKLLSLEDEFNNNILSINNEDNASTSKDNPIVLRVRTVKDYYLPMYILKLENLYNELETKSIGVMISNLYNKLNHSDLDSLINNILEIKDFFIKNISSYENSEHKKVNDKLYELIYILIKRELTEYTDSVLYNKLSVNDKENLNYFLLNDIVKSLKDKKEIQRSLMNKVGLSHDKPFDIEIIKEFIDYLPRKKEVKKAKKAVEQVTNIKNRIVLTKKRVTPVEFKELSGVWPFPRTKEENLFLRDYDISCVDYKDQDLEYCDFSYTNIKFKIKDLHNYSITDTNLEGVDLSKVDFKYANMQGANLKNTNAHINFQEIGGKSIINTNLEGLDLSDADFTKVFVRGAILRYTNVMFDPQVVMDKDLHCTDLEGVDLSHANFKDVRIEFANLKNTKAVIDTQILKWKSLNGTNLEGLDLSNADFTDIAIGEANLRNTHARIDPRNAKNFYKTDLRGCTFIVNDFTDCDIREAIFDEDFVPYIEEDSNKKSGIR